MLFFSFNRLYLSAKFFIYMTSFMSPRSERVCQFYGCEASMIFAVKAFMKKRPFFILIWSLIITTFIFGYQLRLFESPLNEVSG